MLCEARGPFAPLYERHGHRLVRCPECRLVFQDPQPSEAALARAYYHDPEFARSLQGELRPRALGAARAKLERLRPGELPAAGARVLDVGCSSGAWLELAAEAGFEATGVEIGEATAAAARERGLDVITGTLAEALPRLEGRRFDLITFWDVLEHLRDPRRELELARGLLAPGGLLAASFPNVEGLYPQLTLRLLARRTGVWEHPELPVHLYDFAPATARRLFESSGFELRRLETTAIPFEFFREVALSSERIGGGRRARLLRGAFDALHRIAYPLARLGDRGNSIFLVAGARSRPH
jgi:2-polyprenyl-3-methyl-5-hydroxy-6-metoxy-1,4-benzoquinol methylase